MAINDKLRQCRYNSGYTQQNVADYLEIDRSTYAYYETGTTRPSIVILKKLAQLYGVTLDSLTSDDSDLLNVASPTDSASSGISLSKDEMNIIGFFRKIPDDKKEEFLSFIKSFNI